MISVVSHCKETVVQLETVLRGRGHKIESVSESELVEAAGHANTQETGLFIVDLDCDPHEATGNLQRLSEELSTALTPVLVAASPESQRKVALACARGATGLLRKPFTTLETVPDTCTNVRLSALRGCG